MPRHHAFANGYGDDKKRDSDVYRSYTDRSDLESKYIWGMNDLHDPDDEKDAKRFHNYKPARSPLQNRSRLIKQFAAGVILFVVFLYTFLPSSQFREQSPTDVFEVYDIETLRYYDLSDNVGTSVGWEREERVLLCTPLRDAAPHLPMFFAHLRNFTYPHHLIDLAFLVSDSKDNTESLLTELLEALQNDESPTMPYGEISVIHKDFGQAVGQDVESRHGFAAQAGRRKLMAQARNWLLSAALRPYHSWVYWRDADVETCPFTILEDLMRHDKDVIVPSKCLATFARLARWRATLRSQLMQESETALALADTLDEDAVIVEGYAEYATWRPHLAYLRDPYGDPDVEMELDGVGGVSILAKARVFRAGVHFPAFSFEKHAETEGFGKMAKRMKFSVVGLPHYTVWHLYEPSVDDLRHMEEMEQEKKAREQREKDEAEQKQKAKVEFEYVDEDWAKVKEGMAGEAAKHKGAGATERGYKTAAEPELDP
ncbi:Mannan polymerase II complex ANP1 subunit [Cyphellophora attinorum]|uniref:Mannan polymerase II complex ANP1 subunit n=1 Tax=Cyphellophora attinorum TaxID=1664694 RepID=A0A0N1HL08_9EURO|nr:Mannan polymerase II complex ANP1 subunit [Phialophora attinorum]KPI35087.1 Mannan polymerase II complex ANP1 subunit [Phialophora attinorum]